MKRSEEGLKCERVLACLLRATLVTDKALQADDLDAWRDEPFGVITWYSFKEQRAASSDDGTPLYYSFEDESFENAKPSNRGPGNFHRCKAPFYVIARPIGGGMFEACEFRTSALKKYVLSVVPAAVKPHLTRATVEWNREHWERADRHDDAVNILIPVKNVQKNVPHIRFMFPDPEAQS